MYCKKCKDGWVPHYNEAKGICGDCVEEQRERKLKERKEREKRQKEKEWERRYKRKQKEQRGIDLTEEEQEKERREEERKEKSRAQNKLLREALRRQIFDHYGWRCEYCGATENLQLDHINGDGLSDRQSGKGKYKDVIIDGFPDTFQTLCKRCNTIKGNMTHDQFKALIDTLHRNLTSES
jgi:hypothetical protein